MAVGTGQNFAQCELSNLLRDRALSDLNIKGLISIPDKIDVEAIRFVYDFADHTVEEYTTVQPNLDTPIAMESLHASEIINFAMLPINTKMVRLKNLYWVVYIDAAGRAAMAAAVPAAQVRMHLRYFDVQAGIVVEVGYAAWQVIASALNPLTCIVGSHLNVVAAQAFHTPTANICNFVYGTEISFRYNRVNSLQIHTETDMPGGFPANTTLITSSIYSYR